MRFIKYLQEALTLKQVKEIKPAILSKKYKTYLNKVFKGEDRIYLDFDANKEDIKPPKAIDNFIKSNKLKIVNYKKGIVQSGKKILRLGKVLSKNKEQDLLKVFINDKRRTSGKKTDLLIVISRHPYDLAGMSTDRGWTSCMDLQGGMFQKYIHKDIKYGTLVAYIINTNDKNINKPIGRILIKQFINIDNEKDMVLYPEKKVYGSDVSGFRKRIIAWLKTFQKFKGTYEINPELYVDTGTNVIGLGYKDSSDFKIRGLYYQNNPDDKDAKKEFIDIIRKQYYQNHPNDPDAKTDNDYGIKKRYYDNHPEDKDAKTDEYQSIRMEYYKKHPEDKDAKKDSDNDVRRIYYDHHPNDKDAIKDVDSEIRITYYKHNPNDPNAKINDNVNIRKAYYLKNQDDKDAKKDKSLHIRRFYYDNHPNDKDAKTDEYQSIRMEYYENHPNDKDAMKDPGNIVRKQYYHNNPEDKNAKKDDNTRIRELYYYNHPNDKDAMKDDWHYIRKQYYENHPEEEKKK